MYNYENEGIAETNLSLEEQLSIVRSKLWTPEIDKLLRKWKRQVDHRRRGHSNSSSYYSKLHLLFGLPATCLTVFISTGVLATFQNDCSSTNITTTLGAASEWIRLALALIGLLSAILMGIMTFMNFQESSQEHKIAADSYESLYSNIDSVLSIPKTLRGDPVESLKNIRETYDKIMRESPLLPEKYKYDLGYEVAGQNREISKPARSGRLGPTVKIHDISPDNIVLDDRDLEMIQKDKDILKKMAQDLEGKDTPSQKTSIIEKIKGKKSEKSDSKHDESRKHTPRDDSDTPSTYNKEIFDRNNFDSSDDDKEVCIGFDLDEIGGLSGNKAMLAMANLQAQRDRQIQESTYKALQFEMGRLSDTPRKIHAYPQRGSRKNTYSVDGGSAMNINIRGSSNIRNGDSPNHDTPKGGNGTPTGSKKEGSTLEVFVNVASDNINLTPPILLVTPQNPSAVSILSSSAQVASEEEVDGKPENTTKASTTGGV